MWQTNLYIRYTRMMKMHPTNLNDNNDKTYTRTHIQIERERGMESEWVRWKTIAKRNVLHTLASIRIPHISTSLDILAKDQKTKLLLREYILFMGHIAQYISQTLQYKLPIYYVRMYTRIRETNYFSGLCKMCVFVCGRRGPFVYPGICSSNAWTGACAWKIHGFLLHTTFAFQLQNRDAFDSR